MELGSCKVAYAKCPDYGVASLRPALESVLAHQIEAAGGSISGKSLMVKPNWLAWRRKEDIAGVHPALLVELLKLLKDAGAHATIMEIPAVQSAPSIAKAMGIDAELGRLGVKVADFTRYARLKQVDGVRFRNIEAAVEHLDFDAVVNVAKCKTHAMMMLTLCVKNLFGMVKGSERMGWHLAVGKDFPMFADMLLDIYLAVNPKFNILDAVVCMEGNGPGSGDPTVRGFVAGASDALALDASVSSLLDVNDLLILNNAARRGILPSFENIGDAIEAKPLAMPPPPGMITEWGMPLPPFLKGIMRDFVVSRPVLAPDGCTGCGLCVKMCPPQSLKLHDGKPKFDLPNCIRCYCCQEHCPKGAISSKKTFAMKVSAFIEDSVRGLFGRAKR